jgi:hypothetical protein
MIPEWLGSVLDTISPVSPESIKPESMRSGRIKRNLFILNSLPYRMVMKGKCDFKL